MKRILVVEDELVVAADLQQRLEALGYHVPGIAASGEEAVAMAAASRPDLVLMDIVLRGSMDGIAAAEQIRRQLDIPIVFLTAHSDDPTLSRARAADPFGYVVKPFEERTLQIALKLAPHRFAVDRQLRQVGRWLTATLCGIDEGVVATNTQGEVLFLNPAAEKLTGWTQSEAAGQPIERVIRLLGAQSLEPVENPVTRALREKCVVRLPEDTILVAKDAGRPYIEDSAAPIVDDKGAPLGAVLVFRDITERKAAAERIRQLDQEVKRLRGDEIGGATTEDELETLAVALSHDLRAPLRAIGGFAQSLAKDYSGRLDDTGNHFLNTIQSSAREMNDLLEGYLAFLAVSKRDGVPGERIDMEALTREVLDELNGGLTQPVAAATCKPLPPAWGDRWMLRQVMVNLLSNALKFTAKRAQPTIEIGSFPEADGPVYYVKDNGVGFSPKPGGRMFQAFQRFHSTAEFPGTGVGLAIVKRIIEGHGGRVWAESQPGQGATFFFSLPAGPGG